MAAQISPTLPLVTIAIPTYNRAGSYLRPCLEGALGQTYGNLEVIVSDNGSTDATPSLVQRYRDTRLRYYRQPENIRPNDNFNFCLQQARGDYFLLLLDDEQIDNDFVDSCLRAAEFSTRYGLIHTGLRSVNAQGTVINESLNRAAGTSLGEFFLAWFTGRTALYLCNTLFNRVALLGVGGFHSRHNLFQDVVAQVRVAARLPRADVTEIKATTRYHSGQYTYGAAVRGWCEDSLDLLELMAQLAPEHEQEIRARGKRFFANIGYSRASAIRSPFARTRSYLEVYRLFDRRYLPPLRMALRATSIYRTLRQIKRRVLQRPAWVD